MQTTKDSRLGTEKIGKLMLELALPSVLAQIVNVLYNIVDRIYIGHIPGIGAAALTGVGLFAPILMLLNAFAMLVGSGGAPRAARPNRPAQPAGQVSGPSGDAAFEDRLKQFMQESDSRMAGNRLYNDRSRGRRRGGNGRG